MRVFGIGIWIGIGIGIWILLSFGVASVCTNGAEHEGNYMDDYDNEISQEQQGGESPASCRAADLSRWDKLFVALEDSHMRQNMLLTSLEHCCGGVVHLKSQVVRAQAEQAGHVLQRGLLVLRAEEAARWARLNATLQMLLRGEDERNARLKRLEDRSAVPPGHRPTPRPGGLGASLAAGVKPLSTGSDETEATPPPATATVERALVAIATNLERVHRHLSRVTEQTGTLRNDRGDT